ncbi:hypothetical protein [Poriferisphaera sp. WC338]|uniref:hypothetical protein n=1 Tax=Poriferisphaera sp. WC338 TaxID=3425129 RepID=UPI003D817401
MTSKQVMLFFVLLLSAHAMAGCSYTKKYYQKYFGEEQLVDPMSMDTGIYPRRQVWGIVPLRNESGSSSVRGAHLADKLAGQLETQPGIDVLPVNRVLAAMDALEYTEITSPEQALTLRRVLEVDALIVGTVTAYDPYDPPRLGLAIELYVDDQLPWFSQIGDLTELQRAPIDTKTRTNQRATAAESKALYRQPLTVANGYFDAAEPGTRKLLQEYAKGRGVNEKDKNVWRLYRINMDLYTEFVTNIVSRRLMQAELNRLAEMQPKEKPTS